MVLDLVSTVLLAIDGYCIADHTIREGKCGLHVLLTDKWFAT